MRIKRITFQNFCGFEDETLTLDRPLTVLFGPNGAGKSTVVDAAAGLLANVLARAHIFTDGFWGRSFVE